MDAPLRAAVAAAEKAGLTMIAHIGDPREFWNDGEAYAVGSTDGPQLMLGDTTHTRWGWENGVEPGSYSADVPLSAESLGWLKQLAEEVPGITVHTGHQ